MPGRSQFDWCGFAHSQTEGVGHEFSDPGRAHFRLCLQPHEVSPTPSVSASSARKQCGGRIRLYPEIGGARTRQLECVPGTLAEDLRSQPPRVRGE